MHDVQYPAVGNGSLRLPLWFGKFYTVFGGPIRNAPADVSTVKLAKEICVSATHRLDIKDFGVPSRLETRMAVENVLEDIVEGKPVYVGCMGGYGRTGLFLSLLAKTFDVDNPIRYVRSTYNTRAVETPDQEDFVDDFAVSQFMKDKVFDAKIRSVFRLKKSLTRSF